ncbi:MAG: YybS family protein [Gemmatimonadota bacterium]|nr:YybS family protein [Gemmatimonadota bacterium]
MSATTTTPTKKQSWWPLLWGLAGLLLLPLGPPLNEIFPIDQTLLLLVPAVAACAIVGWKVGGRAALAIVWLVFAGWILLQPAGSPGTPYDQMARGWAILLAASFGLVSLWNAALPFFVRALSAVGIATAVGFIIALSSPSGIARFQHAAGSEFSRRAGASIERIEAGRDTPEWRELAAKAPWLDAMQDENETIIRELPDRAAGLLPALLALESLAALALAWGISQRLSPVKIGPALSPLTEFRFNDQLVWGVAVGATLCLLPSFADGRTAGFNLLAFFGVLYLLRGLGVLAWITKGRYLVIGILSLIPPFGVMLGVMALALGLGDTWLDLRRRVKAS